MKFQYQNRNSALDDFNKAIQLKIVYCKADFEKGLDKFFLQDFSGAYLDFSQALVKPITGKVFYNDALEKYKNEEYEVAGQYFTKAIQLGILDWDLFYLRAMCNYSLQNYTIALPDFNEAIKLNSSFVGLYYYRGGTNFSLEKLTDSINDFNKSVSLDKYDADLYFLRGIANQILGNREVAYADFVKSRDLGNEKASEIIERNYS